MNDRFELYAFHSTNERSVCGIEAGLTGMVVDLEVKGKEARQSIYDTQITKHDLGDLVELRKLVSSKIICRINGGNFINKEEIDAVIDSGANEILVPMITELRQVDYLMNLVSNTVDLSIMIETNEAVRLAAQLSEYPLHRIFIGLNDLSIAREEKNIFLPMIDGTVDEVRSHFNCEFGVAGLTHPNAGYPIPCQLLINEMKRLQCTFGFLRRSFYQDLDRYTMREIIRELKNVFAQQEYEVAGSEVLRSQVLSSSKLFA